jgi:site-specific recombinase XerC
MLAMLFECGLRAGLELDDIQTRQEPWAIVDLIGKGDDVRTVPIPHWAKQALDERLSAAGITKGNLSRGEDRDSGT